jgi:uncharacterized protein
MDHVELVRYIVKHLVDNPEEINIKEVIGRQTSVIEVKVAPSDLGKVIGKEGRTAKAIRTILNAIAIKAKKKIILEILD